MLIPLPEELLDNPKCYTEKEGVVGYVPTSIATQKEKKAIAEYNEKWRKGHEQMTQMIGEPPTD